MLHRDLDGHNLISVYYGIGPQYYESGCQWGQGDRRQQHSLMIVDDCWWSLMIVDDRWWSLMGRLGMIQVNWVKQVKVTDETIFKITPFRNVAQKAHHFQQKVHDVCLLMAQSCPLQVLAEVSTPCSADPRSSVPGRICLLIQVCSLLFCFALTRPLASRPVAARGGPLCPRRRFVRNDRPVSWGR